MKHNLLTRIAIAAVNASPHARAIAYGARSQSKACRALYMQEWFCYTGNPSQYIPTLRDADKIAGMIDWYAVGEAAEAAHARHVTREITMQEITRRAELYARHDRNRAAYPID